MDTRTKLVDTGSKLVDTGNKLVETGNKLVNPKNKNLKKAMDKADEYNGITGAKRYAVIATGGAAGETLVVDNEKIGTFGDIFEGGPTELDRDVKVDPSEDAGRKLLNRLKLNSTMNKALII